MSRTIKACFEWNTVAHKADYEGRPARRSLTKAELQELHDSKMLNKDFASATHDDGVEAIATGTAAHYPMLAGVISAVEQNYPDNIDDVGKFAMPTEGTTESQLTLFLPGGFFIPKSTTDEKLVAAKKFVASTQSAKCCDVLVK